MPTLRELLQYEPVELRFGTSGLRGLIVDMTDLECYINTAGFLRFLQQHEQLPQGATVYLAGDLRDSTPRILRAVHQAVVDGGYQTVYCGLIPTPAVAHFALQKQAPCIMVTGSHIPADRNGIKFYKTTGEVLKEDEQNIFAAVAEVRQGLYGQEAVAFDLGGMLRLPAELPAEIAEAAQEYAARYQRVFGPDTFKGREIVFYQHSAVGRDMCVELLRSMGATVTPVGRSEIFVPIDSENVTPQNQAYFKQLAKEHPSAFAIVSTDGDSDRPFVIDERGVFHRGDVLGAVAATWLQADFAAYPISASDATDMYLSQNNVAYEHTKIGSPYVVCAMQEAKSQGKQRITGWEVNGGFMVGCNFDVNGAELKALPTRDAIFPIIVALVSALQQETSVSTLFGSLPDRFTQAGLIDNFPVAVSQAIIARFSSDTPEVRQELSEYFSAERGFGGISGVNALDGVRITFENGDLAHMRPSGNAPQLRIYSVASSQERADEIVALALAEQDGIFRSLQAQLSSNS